MNNDTTSQEFFEQKYRSNTDPWNFASSSYEQDRYEAIIRALDHRRYRRVFEPGCSIGVLTLRLADICNQVDAMDIAPSAVEKARERCGDLAHVRIACAALPDMPFAGDFDLLLLSEIGYYFEADELRRIASGVVSRLEASGVLLATHWLGVSHDHLLSGDDVHEVLGSLDGIKLDHSERRVGFRLDRWVRT